MGSATATIRTSTSLRFDHVGMVLPDGTHAVDDASFQLGRGELVNVAVGVAERCSGSVPLVRWTRRLASRRPGR
jgi:hypothetical protein